MPRRLLTLFATLTLGALGASACHPRHTRVEAVRGPDGQEWKKLACPHLDKHCYSEARSMCPNGYYFAKNPVAIATRETEGDANATARTSAPPAAGANAKTLPPQETWGHEMYSRSPGTLLVRCADAPAGAPKTGDTM